MVRIIRLEAGGKGLRFEIADSGWCQVSLTGTPDVPLGADAWAVIRTRLLQVLDRCSSLDHCGKIDGIPVAWVMSLSEIHTTIYMATCEDRTLLYVQDEATDLIGVITLLDEDRRRWLNKLREEAEGSEGGIPAQDKVDGPEAEEKAGDDTADDQERGKRGLK